MALTKEEFKEKILEQLDGMYNSYKKAEREVGNPVDDILSRLNKMPDFEASNPVITDEKKAELIGELEKASSTEKIMFTVGKVAFAVLIKALL